MNQSTFRTMKQLGLMVLVLATACGDSAQNDSKTASNAGNKALEAKQFDTAVTEFTKATERYPDNHYAWYGLGAAQAKKGDWAKAADAFGRAVQIEDKQPTYQKLFGMALFEKAVASAREDQAKKLNKKPEEIEVDLSQVNFEKPMQHLQEAVKLNGDMWQAHYYLGKIFREQDKPKDAASELSAAIKANPRESGPYIALGELYRKWDYSDEAIKVTSQGVVRARHGLRRQGDGRQGDRGVRQGDRHPQGQPQGEVRARPVLLPQGRLRPREARSRGLLEGRWCVARARQAAGEHDAHADRREVGRGCRADGAARSQAVSRRSREAVADQEEVAKHPHLPRSRGRRGLPCGGPRVFSDALTDRRGGFSDGDSDATQGPWLPFHLWLQHELRVFSALAGHHAVQLA
jgi:Flp pilus assembly protein TadD